MDQLYYELIHNLVLELTRTGIEVKNLKMRVESLTGRLEFNERRARALESAVVYRPSNDERPIRPPQQQQPPPPPAPVQQVQTPQAPAPVAQAAQTSGGVPGEGPGQRSRRRRRRRGRRGGGAAAAQFGSASAAPASEAASAGSAFAAQTQDAASAGQAGEGEDEGSGGTLESEDLGHLADDGGPTEPGSGSDPDAQ
jgi:hypothetical protein